MIIVIDKCVSNEQFYTTTTAWLLYYIFEMHCNFCVLKEVLLYTDPAK